MESRPLQTVPDAVHNEYSFSNDSAALPASHDDAAGTLRRMAVGHKQAYNQPSSRAHNAQKQSVPPSFAAEGKLADSFLGSMFSLDATPIALTSAPAVTLPVVTLPTADVAADARAGARGWRNIPEAVRDSVAGLTDAVRGLAAVTSVLHGGLSRRAGTAEVASALSARASQEQVQALARFVQRDLLARLEQPCPAHTAGARSMAQLTARIGALEAVVTAQDTALAHLLREVSIGRRKRDEVEDGEEGEEGRGKKFVTPDELEARLSAFQAGMRSSLESSLVGSGSLCTPSSHAVIGASTLAAAKEHAERVSAGKADAAVVRALANDVDLLADTLDDMRREASAGKHAGASIHADVGDIHSCLEGLRVEVARLQGRLDTRETRAFNNSQRSPPSGEGEGVALVSSATPGAAGSLAPSTKSAVAAIAESVLRSKLGLLSTSFERQAQATREASSRDLEVKFAALREEVCKDVKSRPVRAEVMRLIAGRPTLDAVRDIIGAEVGRSEGAIRKRLDAEFEGVRADVTAARRLALDAAAQAQVQAQGAQGGKGPVLNAAQVGRDTLQSGVEGGGEFLGLHEEISSIKSSLAALQGARPPGSVVERAPFVERGRAMDGDHGLRVTVAALTASLSSIQDQLTGLQHAHAGPAGSALTAAGGVSAPSSPAPMLTGRWVWKNRLLTGNGGDGGERKREGEADGFTCSSFASRRVLWDVQAVNTSPALLIWKGGSVVDTKGKGEEDVQDGDRADITTVKSGLYRLSLAFFSLIPPTSVTVLVDGLPVISTPPPLDTVTAGPGTGVAQDDSQDTSADSTGLGLGIGRRARTGKAPRGSTGLTSLNTTAIVEGGDSEPYGGMTGTPALVSGMTIGRGGPIIHRHPAGSVAGVSVVHYLALPANAHVSVRYEGPSKGQGFIELQKL